MISIKSLDVDNFICEIITLYGVIKMGFLT